MQSRILLSALLICLLPMACNKRPDNESKSRTPNPSFKPPPEIVQKLEALRKERAPTTAEELRRLYETPPLATNAAPLYAKAFSLLPDPGTFGREFLDYGITNLPPLGAPMPKATLATLTRFCTENAALFESLRVAGQVKQCRHALDFPENLASTPMVYVIKIIQCAKAIRAHCYWLIERGQIDKAVESLCDQVALAESLERDPYMLGQLSRSRVFLESAGGLERLLNRRQLDPTQLAKLERAFQSPSFKDGFKRAYVGERCYAIVVAQLPKDQLTGLPPQGAWAATNRQSWQEFNFDAYRKSAAFTQDFQFILQSYETLITAASSPFPDALAIEKRFAANVQLAITNRYAFSSLLIPAYTEAVTKHARAAGRMLVLRSALAIEKLRMDNKGRLPEDASDSAVRAALAGFTDPFDGKPIRYHRRAANSYVVYSIGPNQKDDGGISTEEADLVFVVAR